MLHILPGINLRWLLVRAIVARGCLLFVAAVCAITPIAAACAKEASAGKPFLLLPRADAARAY
jgi:hypothetical protein